MADESDAQVQTPAAAVEAAKKAFEALVSAGSDEEQPKDSGGTAKDVQPPAVEAGLDSSARAAVKQFRKTARWILGAFVAVGLLIFGSLPFADITRDGRHAWFIGPGLALAAVGISMAIWAVSRVEEPEDASLGELKAELPDAANHAWTWPRRKALYKLSSELAGDDGPNHVGPVYPGVQVGSSAEDRISGLIKSIGEAQKDRYVAAAATASARVRLDAADKNLTARTAAVKVAWDRWVKASEIAIPKVKASSEETKSE